MVTKLKNSGLALLLFSFMLSWHQVTAQDVHLSQYYTSNTSLNPALTGHFDGDWHFQANYRSQWRQVQSPISTAMFSAEKKISRFKNEFGVGLLFINDAVPALQLSTNKIMLAGSYQKYISKYYVRFGLQGGVVQRSFSTGSQTYPTQWNYASGSFDQSAPTGESNLTSSATFPVLNAGIAVSRFFGTSRFTLGYAVFYLNRPNDSFGGAKNQLSNKHAINASARVHLGSKFSLLPNVLYLKANTASNVVLNTLIEKKIKENAAVFLGPGYRGSFGNSDALILYAGVKINRFNVGFSFDNNISKLSKDGDRKSSWEIALSYTSPSTKVQKITIPCDRF